MILNVENKVLHNLWLVTQQIVIIIAISLNKDSLSNVNCTSYRCQ